MIKLINKPKYPAAWVILKDQTQVPKGATLRYEFKTSPSLTYKETYTALGNQNESVILDGNDGYREHYLKSRFSMWMTTPPT